MTSFKVQFPNPKSAREWLKRLHPVLNWVDCSREDACLLQHPLDYPFKPEKIKSCRFLGFDSFERKVPIKHLQEFYDAIRGRLRPILATASSMHFYCEAIICTKPKKSIAVSLSQKKDGITLYFSSHSEMSVADRAQMNRDFAHAMGLRIKIVRRRESFSFRPEDATRVDVRGTAENRLPLATNFILSPGNTAIVLARMMEYLTRSGWRLLDPEFSISFDSPSGGDADAGRKQIDLLNAAQLPISSAQCHPPSASFGTDLNPLWTWKG